MDDLSDDSDISKLPQTVPPLHGPRTSGALDELSDGSDVDLHRGEELPHYKSWHNSVATGVRGRHPATAQASDAVFGTGVNRGDQQTVDPLEGKC